MPQYTYHMEPFDVAVITLTSYEDWYKRSIGKKTRYMIKKAEKNGVEVRIVNFDDDFVRGISEIYNELVIIRFSLLISCW